MRSAIVVCLSILAACSRTPAPEIPLPELAGAEVDVVQAVQHAREVVRQSPGSAQAWAALGDRYRAGRWYDEAVDCYRRAEAFEPKEFRWPYRLGHALLQRDPRQAADALARAIANDPDYAPAHLLYAERLVQLGRDEQARRSFATVLRLDALNPHARVGLGQLALAEGDLPVAREYFESALAIDPHKGDARRALAQVYLAQGDEEGALEQTQLAQRLAYVRTLEDPRGRIDVEPAGSVAQINAGKVLASRGKYEEAAARFRRALQSNPESSSAHYRLGMALLNLGRLNEAAEHLEEFRRIQPESPSYLNGMGELLAARGDVAGAIASWRESLRMHPQDPAIHYALGDLFAGQGNAAAAETHLRESLRLDPFNPQVLFALGALLDRQNRPDEALAVLKESVRLDARSAAVRMYLGTLLWRSGHYAEAVIHLSTAVLLQPDQADTRVNLGLALASTGEIAKAIEQYREALRLRPDDARAYNGLASCLVEQGRVSEAITFYRAAMRLEPGWPIPASRLAWVYATDPDPASRDGAEAIRLAERALASVPNPTPEMLDTLAAAYAEGGRYDDAVRTAQRALDACASAGTKSLEREIGHRLRLYRAGRPYRLRFD